jgi:hypothetical protein
MARRKACINCGQPRQLSEPDNRCTFCHSHIEKYGEERPIYHRKLPTAYCACGKWAEHKNVRVEIGSVVEYYNLCSECLSTQKELETDDWSPTADPQSAWHYAEYHPVFFGNKYPVRVR